MLLLILRTFISALRSHRALALENLALRHQLEVLRQNTKRPRLTNLDRNLWIILSRFWTDWQKSLLVVQPETVIRWQKEGSGSTEDGRVDRDGREDGGFPWISLILSAICREPIHSGVRQGYRIGRLLHSSDGDLSCAVRFPYYEQRSTERYPFQCD